MLDKNDLLAIAELMDLKLQPLQEGLTELKGKVSTLQSTQDDIKNRVVKIELTQENEVSRKIQLLYEGQKDTLQKFHQLDDLTEKVEDIQTTVEVLKVLTIKK